MKNSLNHNWNKYPKSAQAFADYLNEREGNSEQNKNERCQ